MPAQGVFARVHYLITVVKLTVAFHLLQAVERPTMLIRLLKQKPVATL